MPPKAVNKGAKKAKKPVANAEPNEKPKKPAQKPKKPAKLTEADMVRIQKAKEERALALYYEVGEPEPEEESLEQKIRRNKKELSDNRVR